MWRSSAITDGRMRSKDDKEISRVPRRAGRSPLTWAMLGAVAAALVAWPPVRFHRYEAGKLAGGGANASAGKGGSLSPSDAAQRFWTQQLVPATQKAADAR